MSTATQRQSLHPRPWRLSCQITQQMRPTLGTGLGAGGGGGGGFEGGMKWLWD